MANGIILNNVKAFSNMEASAFKKQFGNAQFSLNTSGKVNVKDCVFDQNGYNCIEIGLNNGITPPSAIDIENCDFSGQLLNNAILIFGTQDNAVINIKNCKFGTLSNAIRLSNRTNAKNVVVNIENCSVEQWETKNPYVGFLILEDYTSKNEEDFLEANRFSPEKLTINISNLQYKGEKVVPEDLAAVVSSKNEKQLIYISVDNVNYMIPEYDAEMYPVINFK